MALDSRVAFQQRAAQVDIPTADIDALEVAGIDTFAKYAFCSQYQPGAPDERPLVEFLTNCLGGAPTEAMMSKYRRLFFESHALCLQDLRQKVERTDHTETKVLPLAEKRTDQSGQSKTARTFGHTAAGAIPSISGQGCSTMGRK